MGNNVRQSKVSTTCLSAVHISILVFVSMLIFLPVLLKPHWGTFDDPAIIVQLGRGIDGIPNLFAHVIAGGLQRRGFFWFLMLLWKLAPENPGFFFLINSGIFAATSALTYCNAFLLSGRPWLSFATTSLLFTVPGLFEVIYALDKQEMYLPLLFSICILIHTISAIFDLSRKQVALSASALFVTSLAAYSLKETSGLLILFSGVVCLSALLTKTASTGKLRKNFILPAATMLPWMFNLLGKGNASSHHYISLTFDPAIIFNKMMAYSQLMPLYFAATFLIVAASVFLLLSRKQNEQGYRKNSNVYTGLAVCCIAAPIAFASFNTFGTALLLYIWFPAYVFLLPALAFSIASLVNKRKKLELVAASSLVLFVLMDFPIEWLRGQFQLKMDTLTHDVAKAGANLCKGTSSQIIGALPTFSPLSYEVPENLEFFIRDQLEPGYFDQVNEKPSEHKFAMLNFLTTNIDGDDLSSLRNDLGLTFPCQYQCPPDFTGWRGYQMLAGGTFLKNWASRPLPRNSLLFIPYGNVPQKIAHRGQGLFSTDVQSLLYSFPQLKLAEICTLEKNIGNVYGEKYRLGWKIYRVVDTQPISIPGSTVDSWFSSDQKLFYNSPKRTLEFESTQPISANWLVINEQGETQDFSPQLKKGRLHANVTLSKESPGRHWLQFHNKNLNERLHCDMTELTTANQAVLELGLTTDKWLIDGSTILFSDQLTNHKLFIDSDRNFASGMFVQGINKAPIKVHDHGIEISLSDARHLANGVQCLTLHTTSPLQSEQEHRQLIIHVTGHSVRR